MTWKETDNMMNNQRKNYRYNDNVDLEIIKNNIFYDKKHIIQTDFTDLHFYGIKEHIIVIMYYCIYKERIIAIDFK